MIVVVPLIVAKKVPLHDELAEICSAPLPSNDVPFEKALPFAVKVRVAPLSALSDAVFATAELTCRVPVSAQIWLVLVIAEPPPSVDVEVPALFLIVPLF